MEPGGFDNAPAPFTGLSGLFYVDEQGLVYHCDEETDEAALVATLLAEYDVDEARASAAVAAFVKKLEANNFLA